MADDLNPRQGGNPLLDQFIAADPQSMQRFMQAGMEPPERAYKTLYGEEYPYSNVTLNPGTAVARDAYLGDHSALRNTVLQHMSKTMLDPLYGSTLGAYSKASGQKILDVASPDQIKMVPGAPLEREGPRQQKATFLGSPDSVAGKAIDPYFDQPGGQRGPDVPYADPKQLLNSTQRAFAGSELHRRSSPYYGMIRGQAANKTALAQQSAAAYGLDPDSDEYDAFMARALNPALKPQAASDSNEAAGIAASTSLKNAITNKTQIATQALPQQNQDKHDNIQSQISARDRASRLAQGVHQSLINQRNANTASVNAKTAGVHPDQELKAIGMDNAENQRQFLRTAFGASDPKDLLDPEYQNQLIDEMIHRFGGSGQGGTDKVSGMRKLGKAVGAVETPPDITHVPPSATPAQDYIRSRKAKAGQPQQQPQDTGIPKVTDAGEHLQALQKQIGDLSKHEGQSFDDTATGRRYRVQGGGLVEVSK